MSGVGDQGLRPEHIQSQPPDDEQLAAEAEETERRPRAPRRPDEPPVEPADQGRSDDGGSLRTQRNP